MILYKLICRLRGHKYRRAFGKDYADREFDLQMRCEYLKMAACALGLLLCFVYIVVML